MDQYDCFLCHASEDKEDLVQPLADILTQFGARIWYDRFVLKAGDSLSRKIDEGLATSTYGAVVLSPDFFQKAWPEYELRGLVARELGSKKVIIPIWHNVTKDEVLSYSPPLADKMAIVNNNETIEALSLKLLEAIRPDISQNISRIIAYRKHVQSLPTQKASLNQIQRSREVRHKQLSPKQVVRIRNIRTALLEVFDSPFEDWLDGFKRDVDVDSEIWIWEEIVAGYNVYKELFKPEVEELKGVFGTLLSASTNDIEETLEPEMLYGLDQNKRHTALKIWSEVSKEVNLVIEAE